MDHQVRRLIETAPLVVADFDGTLATLAPDWPAIKRRLADEARLFGLPWHPADGLDANLRRLRGHDSMAFPWLCGLLAEAEMAGFDARHTHPALIAALALRAKRSTAVFTANTRMAVSVMLRHGVFAGLAPYLVAKEDVHHGKPHPEGLFRICAHFGRAPAEGLMIGDAEGDRRAAAAAGMPFLFVHQLVAPPCLTMPAA